MSDPVTYHKMYDTVDRDDFSAFQMLLGKPDQRRAEAGDLRALRPGVRWVRSAIMEAFSDVDRRKGMTESANIFRVLIKTRLKAGIITERTRAVYGQWVDMDELAAGSCPASV
jgi:hypothetical protein